MKYVLDPCCGSRMFWFDKNDERAVFTDNREMETQAIWKNDYGTAVRYCTIKPDIKCDVRSLPFPDGEFYHVVLDPPHLLRAGETSWIGKKYGKLDEEWRPFIRDAFAECWRVLRPGGTLIFKWAEIDIPLKEVLKQIPQKPLYGHRSGKHATTHWLAFVKEPE